MRRGRAIPDGRRRDSGTEPRIDSDRRSHRGDANAIALVCVCVRSHGADLASVGVDAWDWTCSRFKARLHAPLQRTTIYSLASSIVPLDVAYTVLHLSTSAVIPGPMSTNSCPVPQPTSRHRLFGYSLGPTSYDALYNEPFEQRSGTTSVR